MPGSGARQPSWNTELSTDGFGNVMNRHTWSAERSFTLRVRQWQVPVKA
jgi:hypothetical protein